MHKQYAEFKLKELEKEYMETCLKVESLEKEMNRYKKRMNEVEVLTCQPKTVISKNGRYISGMVKHFRKNEIYYTDNKHDAMEFTRDDFDIVRLVKGKLITI